MKTALIVLSSFLLFGCTHTPAPIMAHALPEHEVSVRQILLVKTANGQVDESSAATVNDEEVNPYDVLIEEQEQAEVEQQKAARQAEEDQKLHNLMVKAVWGNCVPHDPLCATVNKEPEVKASDSK